ncbi:hypothetical protein VC83_08402 [Pseudogymnoascus destructans]|uniref:Uncharacterized protein n=2 Tax=Pseudogymnoascus destructans TaxID=655981 RepID=L8G151_PSED2|nr:uncharacterized protein VC83_08402 [Pseudogymnoascus destructans]ELR06443.1 hypothetical protein GMDG_07968 [Pseudogymnoascus destructans 20631-21]OAF55209.1 hypothetical protein VC83_08402 [Pseudogymnoascus destructans]
MDTKGYAIHAPSDRHVQPLTRIASTPQPHLILDCNERIIAYKFQVPIALIDKLAEASEKLPPKSAKAHQGGHFECSHYAFEAFLKANEDLFWQLSSRLRLLSPELYRRYGRVDKHLSESQKRLGGAWHGTVVNRQIGNSDELRAHKDWKDWPKGLNAVVPWGDYQGGALTMYNLGLQWEMRPGDVIFFGGRVVSHGVEDVLSGVRNSLNLMVHTSTIRWVEKQELDENEELAKRQGKKKLGRNRRRDREEDSTGSR